MFNNNEDTLITDFKRKVPGNLRPSPGTVPSTVFSAPKTLLQNSFPPQSDEALYFLMEHRSQQQEQDMKRFEEKKNDMRMLKDYNPWGKPGGGAPQSFGPAYCGLDLDKNLNVDEKNLPFVEQLGKPGNGAPYRSESGNPLGVVQRHAEIRNDPDLYNEELKKKSIDLSFNPALPRYKNGAPYYARPQVLGSRVATTDDSTKAMLRDRLDKQIAEKRDSQINNQIENIDSYVWGQGQVGYIQRDLSGKVVRSEPLGERDVDGVREYTNDVPREGLIYDLGKPGPGAPTRTKSGSVQPAPRGIIAINRDDPFRPGRQSLSPRDPRTANQVFPTNLELQALDRASKRHHSTSPHSNIHTIQNGYYGDSNITDPIPVVPSQDEGEKIGTVYSAVFRVKENYLNDLRLQIEEKNDVKNQERLDSLAQDRQHIKSCNIFGRPGNGAPRLDHGQLATVRRKLDELETHGSGVQNATLFRPK